MNLIRSGAAPRIAILVAIAATYGPGSVFALTPPRLERPVAFDSAERITAVSPALATRLALAPPDWPIDSPFREARLYEGESNEFVLVAERDDGATLRWTLTPAERDALRTIVDRGSAAAGNVLATQRLDEFAEPAGGRFVRGQVALATVVYGPSAALLAADDGESAGALYLATTGATIFVAAKLSKSRTITKPAAHLATDGGWKGAAIGAGLAYVTGFDADEDGEDRAFGAMTLGGGLVGSGLGLRFGRAMTDAESHGASFGSTIGAALTAGGIGIGGGFEDDGPDDSDRAEVAGVVAGALAGYPLGRQYARRASYAITSGDVGALTAASALGVLAASTFVVDREGTSGSEVSAILTCGLLAGTVAGDRLLVRPFDHTENEGWLVGIGAVAGGLIAAAIPALDESSEAHVAIGAASIGAILGMTVTEKMLAPKKGARR